MSNYIYVRYIFISLFGKFAKYCASQNTVLTEMQEQKNISPRTITVK